MNARPPGPPDGGSGGSAILMLVILLIVVAGLFVWAQSRHPAGSAHPAATGVPPTAPPRANQTPH